MKRILLGIALMFAMAMVAFSTSDSEAMCTFGLHRDSACFDAFHEAQCQFPPLLNLCQAPCRNAGLQKQSVPCAFDTACPAGILPAHGISYGANPYPLFGLR